MQRRIIAAGHISLDITPVFDPAEKRSVHELFVPGKLVQVDSVNIHTGGSVTNTGLALKIMGADVRLIGAVGDDAMGDMTVNLLRVYGCEKDVVTIKGGNSSYTIVLSPPGCDRMFLHCPGVNDELCENDISGESLRKADLFHFGYPPMMKRFYENGGEQLEGLLKRAKEAGCATSLDLVLVDANSVSGKKDWRSILSRVLPYVDFFVPSVEELCFMLDRPLCDKLRKEADGRDFVELADNALVRRLAEESLALGAGAVMIKRGERGLYFVSGSKQRLDAVGGGLAPYAAAQCDKTLLQGCFIPPEIKSGTGAGDVCIAAFLLALSREYPFERCLELASAAGALCVSSYDSTGALVPFDELIHRVDAGWPRR